MRIWFSILLVIWSAFNTQDRIRPIRNMVIPIRPTEMADTSGRERIDFIAVLTSFWNVEKFSISEHHLFLRVEIAQDFPVLQRQSTMGELPD